MKDLERRERRPGAIPDLATRPRQLIFLTPVNTALRAFLQEIHQIACAEPAIVECIEEDLDRHAKAKKLLRLADAQFLAGQTPDLPRLQLPLRDLALDHLELEAGRPRTEAYVVYLFLMLRGFNGGCKDRPARLLLEESITLRLWLEPLGLEVPPASTLSENLNAVSNQTRHLIHRAQLRSVLGEGLDDFQKCFIDSTAVAAHTDRPTDSSLLLKLTARICTAGARLDRLGLPNLPAVGLDVQQEELRRLSQQILFLNGKARREGLRRKRYFQLLRRVRRLRRRLLRDFESIQGHLAQRVDLPPSRRLLAEEAVGLLRDDLQALAQAADVCERRVLQGEKVPMAEKIISLSDADASFIVKGSWNTVVGYRPQLARSGQGLVTALVLPRGNAADSPHLVPMVETQIANTGVIPALASVDDGYSSEQGRTDVLSLGVKVVSVSGAKGKKIIAPAQWKSPAYRRARAERSAIESLMFTLKECFEFGELRRRTQENVLAELLEKVLAYNICQIIRVRQRRQASSATAAAAA